MSDLIDRQAAIDEIRNYYDPEDTSVTSIEDRIKRLPSVQPEVPDFVEWRACETCRYNGLNWDDEPCDSCTNGGENNHWKPSAQPELSDEEKRLYKKLRSYHNGSYAKLLDKMMASAQPYANDALEDAYAHGYTYAESKFREMLDAQPEVIRCKDCVYYDPSESDEESDWCHVWGETTEGNAFCSYAKRKGEQP